MSEASNPVKGEGQEAVDVRALVRRARSGDQEAFGELVRTYHARVYGLAYRMVNNMDDAKELEQQTWIKVWNKLHTFKEDAQFFTWLYRIGTNTCLDFIRSRARQREDSLTEMAEHGGELALERPADARARPDRELEQREVREAFERALGSLSPEHRMALVLREVEGLSYEEIAKAMKCRKGTVMSRIFYARRSIRDKLGELR